MTRKVSRAAMARCRRVYSAWPSSACQSHLEVSYPMQSNARGAGSMHMAIDL
jgi:hypothetical protein